MGYTHYWHQKRDFKVAEWKAITDNTTALLASNNLPPLLYEADSNELPLVDKDTIRFNGKLDDGHETFILTRKRRAPYDYETAEDARGGSFDFCKTARKPYDAAVVAVLLFAAHAAPGAISLSSDGDLEDWGDGLSLARTIVPEIQNRGEH